MYYEVYIDVLFFSNFLLDYVLLLFIWRIVKCSSTRWRILLGAAMGAGLTCVVVLIPFPYTIIKIALFHMVVNSIMIKTAYEIKDRFLFFEILGMLYISSFLLGGILTWIKSPFMNVIIPWIQRITGSRLVTCMVLVMGIGFGYFLMKKIGVFIIHMRKNQKSKCRVVLYTSTGEYELQALLDTGNELTDALSKKPVSVIDRSLADRILKEQEMQTVRYVPYRSIGKEGVLQAVRISKMEIKISADLSDSKQKYCVEEPIIGISERKISEKKAYQIILNPDVLGGK